MDISIRPDGEWGQDDQSWLGSAHGTQSARPVTLDRALFDEPTHYPKGHFPSGLPLGRVTASGLFGPYDPAATDGRDQLAGFLFTARSATGPRVGAALLDHGRVITARLPVAFEAPAGNGHFIFL